MPNPTYFTVVADFKSVVVDLASDVDPDPQLGPITAKVTFTPVLGNGDVILATNASPRPTVFVPAPIVARIDTDGRLKLRVEPDGDRDDYANLAAFPATGIAGTKVYFAIDTQTFYRWDAGSSQYIEDYPYAQVRLLADTNLLELNSPLYYRVTFSEVVFNGGPGYINSFTFQAPTSDTELNLVDVTRVPGQPASGITKIAPGAVRAEDGNLIFSFGGVDLDEPIPYTDVDVTLDAADISDGTPTGRSLITAASAAAARTAINADFMVSAKDFGAVGNGSTDDTAALQAWLTHIVTTRKQGWLPTGTYKITSTLVAPGANYGWGILGENENFAVISQFSDNIPVIQVGTTAGSSHTISLRRFMLKYNTAQPSTNTNANCIVFDGSATGDLSSVYWSSFRELQFRNGYYGMKVAAGRFVPWASEWDMLGMSSMSGGMYDNSGSATSGAPNNRWGRMTLSCQDSVGPIFKDIRAYNMVIGTLEFLSATNGPQLMTTQSGFAADIGAMKLEVGTYTGAGKGLFQFSNPCDVRIGQIHIGGSSTTFTPSSGILSMVLTSGAIGATGPGSIEIGSIVADAVTLSGSCVAVNGSGSNVTVRNYRLEDGWVLTSPGSSTAADWVRVGSDTTNRISANLGDANYTVALGDPNVLEWNTAFTTQRTITLPAQSDTGLFNGLYYDLVFDGAINGANTAVIKRGATTMRTQTVDKQRLRFMWRRYATTGEWTLVEVVDIGGSTAVGSSLISAVDAAAARTAIGAGTSSLVIGTTSTTAKAGDYQPASTNISDSTATGRSLLTATDAAAARTTLSSAKNTDVQVFTSSGTWTKPAGAVAVRVRCIGPGGGGGAGARGSSGTALSGGGGGSSGGMSEMLFDAADFSAPVTVTVGTGGAGASGQTTNGTAGANGSPGVNSTTFGDHVFGGRGAGGTGGGLASAGTGGVGTGSGFSLGSAPGGAGGAGSATGAAGAGGTGAAGGGGGGGGGGITAAGPTATAGGVGGRPWANQVTAGTAGSGADGGTGVSSSSRGPGSGGGGGGASTTAAGFNGGNGGTHGGGGGGGGASLNGSTSGGGGNGADGICIVTTYF